MANPFYPPKASREIAGGGGASAHHPTLGVSDANAAAASTSTSSFSSYGREDAYHQSHVVPFDPHRQPHFYGASTSAAAKRHSGHDAQPPSSDGHGRGGAIAATLRRMSGDRDRSPVAPQAFASSSSSLGGVQPRSAEDATSASHAYPPAPAPYAMSSGLPGMRGAPAGSGSGYGGGGSAFTPSPAAAAAAASQPQATWRGLPAPARKWTGNGPTSAAALYDATTRVLVDNGAGGAAVATDGWATPPYSQQSAASTGAGAGAGKGAAATTTTPKYAEVPMSSVAFLAPPHGATSWTDYQPASATESARPASPAFFRDRPPKLDKLTPEQRKIVASFPKDLDEDGGTMWNDVIKTLRSWRQFVRWKYVPYYVGFVLVCVVVALMSIYHKQIVDWLTPISQKIRSVAWGWVIVVAILFVISFPPLFGHEIVGVLCGVVYGLWMGFAIFSLGTVLGELGNFFAFKYLFRSLAEKYERKSINYACMAHIVREGGFFVVLLARLSAIPGHFTTAVFATVGMNVFVFTLATVLSLPKQLAVVYLGVAIAQAGGAGGESQASKIVKWVVLIISFIVTMWAAWYLYGKMDLARPIVQARLRERRFTMLSEAQILEGYDSRSPLDGSPWSAEMSSAKPLYHQGEASGRHHVQGDGDDSVAPPSRMQRMGGSADANDAPTRKPSRRSSARGQRSSGGWSRWVNPGSRGEDDYEEDYDGDLEHGAAGQRAGMRRGMLDAAAPLGRIPSASAESLIPRQHREPLHALETSDYDGASHPQASGYYGAGLAPADEESAYRRRLDSSHTGPQVRLEQDADPARGWADQTLAAYPGADARGGGAGAVHAGDPGRGPRIFASQAPTNSAAAAWRPRDEAGQREAEARRWANHSAASGAPSSAYATPPASASPAPAESQAMAAAAAAAALSPHGGWRVHEGGDGVAASPLEGGIRVVTSSKYAAAMGHGQRREGQDAGAMEGIAPPPSYEEVSSSSAGAAAAPGGESSRSRHEDSHVSRSRTGTEASEKWTGGMAV